MGTTYDPTCRMDGGGVSNTSNVHRVGGLFGIGLLCCLGGKFCNFVPDFTLMTLTRVLFI